MTPSKVTSCWPPLMVKTGYLRWVTIPPSSVYSGLPTTMESPGEQPSRTPPAPEDPLFIISAVYSISPQAWSEMSCECCQCSSGVLDAPGNLPLSYIKRDTQPEAQPEDLPEAQPEAQPEAHPEVEPEAQPEAPSPKPSLRPTPRSNLRSSPRLNFLLHPLAVSFPSHLLPTFVLYVVNKLFNSFVGMDAM
jgi:hypothetical protein